VWGVELLYALKPLLPPAYRVYIGTTPTFTVGGTAGGRPDVGVRDWPGDEPADPAAIDLDFDEEAVTATLTGDTAVLVERAGRLVAAVELVSPRNKDRVSAQESYAAIYSGYLIRRVNLLLVDVHRRPAGFSFHDRITAELGLTRPSLPAPYAVSYRVGGPAPNGGRFLATWRRPLAVGEPLPTPPLALSPDESVPLDLDGTYRRAAEAAYLG
jgi:hypothetical protein